jgi:hypothetical protein
MLGQSILDRWWKCSTCKKDFSGAMQLGLAEAWRSILERLSKEDAPRVTTAMTRTAKALNSLRKYDEAETMFRDVSVHSLPLPSHLVNRA